MQSHHMLGSFNLGAGRCLRMHAISMEKEEEDDDQTAFNEPKNPSKLGS